MTDLTNHQQIEAIAVAASDATHEKALEVGANWGHVVAALLGVAATIATEAMGADDDFYVALEQELRSVASRRLNNLRKERKRIVESN